MSTYKHIAVRHDAEVTVVAIAKASLAAINESTFPGPKADELFAEFEQALTGSGGVVIDLRDTTYLDHGSVAVLAQLARHLESQGLPRAMCCSRAVKEVLDLCRIHQLCPVVSGIEEAFRVAGAR